MSAFWERGSPDLPACSLRRGSKGGPVRPIFFKARLKTLPRGQATRGRRQEASSGTASSGWLARRRRGQGRTRRRGALAPSLPMVPERRRGHHHHRDLHQHLRHLHQHLHLSALWERGSPDLPACGLWRGSKGGGPARPIFINTCSRPSRGAKPRGADDKRLP